MKNIKPKKVIEIVCKYYGITEEKLNENRTLGSVRPRQMAICLMRKHCKINRGFDRFTEITLREVGSAFKNKVGKPLHHSTIIHAMNNIDSAKEFYKDIQYDFEDLTKLIEIEKDREEKVFIKEEIKFTESYLEMLNQKLAS